jgi:tetratricopeptide (TPR) repeat protein
MSSEKLLPSAGIVCLLSCGLLACFSFTPARATEIPPDTHTRAGDQLAASRRFDDAIEQYMLSLLANPDNQLVRNDLNECLIAQGQEPQDLKFRLKRAKHFARQKQLAEAAVEYGECVRIKASGENYFFYGRALSDIGRLIPARAALASAMAAEWSEHHVREKLECEELLAKLKE